MHRLLQRQLKKSFGRTEGLSAEIQHLVDAVGAAYEQADEDRAMIERSMELSSRELLARNNELAVAESKYRQIFENVTEGIFQFSAAGKYISVNPALARIFGYETPQQLMSEVTNLAGQIYVDPGRWAELEQSIARHGTVSNAESRVRRKDHSIIWISETSRAVRDPQGELLFYEGTIWDITTRKQAQIDREEMQSRLITLSRQAGMAEIATGVLHNVGNVLNSINVSASLVTDRLRASRLPGLGKLTTMLAEHANDLAEFLTQDSRGKQVPPYLEQLAECLGTEQQDVLKELNSLVANVEHVKRIVTMQQGFAKASAVNEEFEVAKVVEEAIRMNQESIDRHHMTIVREFEALPPILAEKHQVLQILVNLIANAKQAMRTIPRQRTLLVRAGRTGADPQRLFIQVSDTGVGIEKENLTRIFAHGFTTRADGHGFGLHSAALAASTLKGSLVAHSDGPGTGATFTLELPLTTKSQDEQMGRAA